MIHLAAQLGLGALTFAFVDVDEAKHWVADYYETFKRECTPIAQAVNPNIAMVTGFSCHRDRAEAERRGLEGFQFFGFALAHYYLLGDHVPGRTSVWDLFHGKQMPMPGGSAGSARRTTCARRCACSRRPASTRRSSSSRAGTTGTTDICAALELFATR